MKDGAKDGSHAVRVLSYDGDKTKWHQWEYQAMLMAGRGHFVSALTRDLGQLISELTMLSLGTDPFCRHAAPEARRLRQTMASTTK
jgi:hypothetical protein